MEDVPDFDLHEHDAELDEHMDEGQIEDDELQDIEGLASTPEEREGLGNSLD